jgi:hypothetical protein
MRRLAHQIPLTAVGDGAKKTARIFHNCRAPIGRTWRVHFGESGWLFVCSCSTPISQKVSRAPKVFEKNFEFVAHFFFFFFFFFSFSFLLDKEWLTMPMLLLW